MSRMEPLEVWKVELAAGRVHEDEAGTLYLGQDALEFHPSEGQGPPSRMRYTSITRCKRTLGSSILVLQWNEGGIGRTTAFYLVKPPPLESAAGLGASVLAPRGADGIRPPSKRKMRRRNGYYLTATGAPLKPLLVEWVREIRAQVRDAGAQPAG
jgi:hypothetical protein